MGDEKESFDPSESTVGEVLEYIEEHPDEEDAVLAAEAEGKGRKGLVEAEVTADPATEEAAADPSDGAPEPEPEVEDSSVEDTEDEVPVATGARTVQQAHVNAQKIQADYRAERMRAKRADYLADAEEE